MKASKFATGLAIGVVLGILFAPDKGKNTRKKIGSLKGKLQDFTQSAADTFEGLKNDANEMINSGKAKVDQWKSKASNSSV
ncbi:MAG: YtxH domain-containing protein [Bacteroidota bacterium]